MQMNMIYNLPAVAAYIEHQFVSRKPQFFRSAFGFVYKMPNQRLIFVLNFFNGRNVFFLNRQIMHGG